MKNCYLGIDIGSISTKGVIIDENNHIIRSLYIWTEGNPIKATEKLINGLKEGLVDDYVIKGIGTTGSARINVRCKCCQKRNNGTCCWNFI